MRISFQGSDNKKEVDEFEKSTGLKVINAEAFKGVARGHKFSVGQRCRLVGLEDYPQFNGDEVEISSIREDGPHGKAYYFKPDNKAIFKCLNWTYEYRLEAI